MGSQSADKCENWEFAKVPNIRGQLKHCGLGPFKATPAQHEEGG